MNEESSKQKSYMSGLVDGIVIGKKFAEWTQKNDYNMINSFYWANCKIVEDEQEHYTTDELFNKWNDEKQ